MWSKGEATKIYTREQIIKKFEARGIKVHRIMTTGDLFQPIANQCPGDYWENRYLPAYNEAKKAVNAIDALTLDQADKEAMKLAVVQLIIGSKNTDMASTIKIGNQEI